MKENLFLIGFMGAGKSTVAKQLAKKMNMTLVEMDQRIVDEQQMSINEIFAQYGEKHFRDIESELVVKLGEEGNCIVSCGGGVVVRAENTANMKQHGKIVYLTASPETIYQRVKNGKDRPILNGHMNVEYIAELMAKRADLYDGAADIKIATDGKNIEKICEEIIAAVCVDG